MHRRTGGEHPRKRGLGCSGLLASAAGLMTGLALSLATLRLLRSALYGVSVYDPVTLITTCGVLLTIALLATAIPARRIIEVNPAETLRAE